MKFLAVLLVAGFSVGISHKSFGQSATPDFSDREVDGACFSLEALKRILACYTLQTKEACLRESKWRSVSGTEENAEVNFITEINKAREKTRSMLQTFGSSLSCHESQGDTQQCPKRGPVFKTLVEEKTFCSLNLECGDQETEDECQERQNNELDCNVKAVAAAQERFCSDWIPADKLTGTPPKS